MYIITQENANGQPAKKRKENQHKTKSPTDRGRTFGGLAHPHISLILGLDASFEPLSLASESARVV
jgi:hypothetical protein